MEASRIASASLMLLLMTRPEARAQDKLLTIGDAVQEAINRYPAVRASQEDVAAAAAGISLARTSYLPRLDLLGQANRATHNNVFGMVLPQQVIAPISGPVLGTNSPGSVWGTAVGTLVTWEPFDFGLRRAAVEVAEASRNRANAQTSLTKLQVAAATADAFLTFLAAQQTVVAAQAAVERGRILSQVVETLFKNELRPGADASRTRAELAVAQTQLIQAEQAVDIAKSTLSQFLGIPASAIVVQPGPMLELPPNSQMAELALASHPAAIAQNTAVEEAKARERVLDRSYYPKFNVQGTVYARGTGAFPDGTTGGPASGLGPNIQNWGVGLSASFPVMDIASIRIRKQIEEARQRAESARYNQVLQDLGAQVERAKTILASATRIAQNTPVQLAAARATEQQATARYRAGLGNIAEVAEAQRILAQAEIDDALAKLGVWRGMLAVNAAQGDLQPFLQQSSR